MQINELMRKTWQEHAIYKQRICIWSMNESKCEYVSGLFQTAAVCVLLLDVTDTPIVSTSTDQSTTKQLLELNMCSH